METGIRVLLLTAVLLALPGCASVRNWFHHRSEVRQARARPRKKQRRPMRRPPRRTPRPPRPGSSSPEVERRKIKVPQDQELEHRARAAIRLRCRSRISAPSPPTVCRAAYHITEDFFFQGECGPRLRRAHQLRDPRRQYPTAYRVLRGASRITISRSATTSCLARPFSVAASP